MDALGALNYRQDQHLKVKDFWIGFLLRFLPVQNWRFRNSEKSMHLIARLSVFSADWFRPNPIIFRCRPTASDRTIIRILKKLLPKKSDDWSRPIQLSSDVAQRHLIAQLSVFTKTRAAKNIAQKSSDGAQSNFRSTFVFFFSPKFDLRMEFRIGILLLLLYWFKICVCFAAKLGQAALRKQPKIGEIAHSYCYPEMHLIQL